MVTEMTTYTNERFPELERLFLDWHRIKSIREIPNIANIYTGDDDVWSETFYRTLASEFLYESGVYEDSVDELINEFIADAFSLVERTLRKKLKEYAVRHGTFVVDSDDEEGMSIIYNAPVRSVW